MNNAISLMSGLDGMPFSFKLVRDGVRLRARAMLLPRLTERWLGLLNSHPLFGDLVRSYPLLVHKVYRCYFSTTLDGGQRLDALTAHYRHIIGLGLGPLVARAARSPAELATFEGKSGAAYRLVLRSAAIMEREGELVLQLLCGDALVCSTAFSFLRERGRLAIGVGCMQGPRGEDGLERVKAATRDLHGIRPKNLMVKLVRQFGFEHGCGDLILVGNDNRAVRKSCRKGLVFADYDSLWTEMGGQRRADGNYSLRCVAFPELNLEEIASNKRSEARKRHQLVRGLHDAVRERLTAARGEADNYRMAPQIGLPLASSSTSWTVPSTSTVTSTVNWS